MKGLFAKYGLRETVPILATNTAFARSLIGTPVTPALAARSLIFANPTSNGDILIAANEGGNSQAYIWIDGSAGQMNLYGSGTLAMSITASAITLSLALTQNADLVVGDTYGIIVGSATQITISDGDGATNMIPELQVLGTGAADGSLAVASFNTTNTRAVAPHIALVKGAAATQVATTAVADNEVVGSIIAYGSDGTDFESPVAAIEFVVDDVSGPTTGQMGGSLEFYTTADGGETLTLSFTINNDQNIYVGNNNGVVIGHTAQLTASVASEFQVLGTAQADSQITVGRFGATNAGAILALLRSPNAAIGSHTSVADNDFLGEVVFLADDGTTFNTIPARFMARVDDASPATGDIGGEFVWDSLPGAAGARREVMTLNAAGNLDLPFTLTVGTAGTRTGTIGIDGATSGTVTVTVAATAGTWTYTLPATAGEAGDVQVTDGAGVASWVSGMRSVDVQLTNAQLLALLGTDVTLVAAPGANRAIVVHAIYLFFDVTTTAYTINAGATTIGYASDGANVATITEAGFLDTVADAGRWYQMGGATATPDVVVPVANSAIVIRKATADMTGGNAANTLSIRVYYSVVDMAAFT